MKIYDWREGLSFVKVCGDGSIVVRLKFEGDPPTTLGELDWWTPDNSDWILSYEGRRAVAWHGPTSALRGVRPDLKNYTLYFCLPKTVWDAINKPEDNEFGSVAL